MQIGIVGIGKMGANMAQRLTSKGHECFAYDVDREKTRALATLGIATFDDVETFIQKIAPPRVVWVMVPAGQPTQKAIAALATLMQAGDILIDGGNTFYQDDIKQEQELKKKGIHFLDVGTSGGLMGLERGYCLMIGGDKSIFEYCEPLFHSLSPATTDSTRDNGSGENGYLHCGPTGSGHFVKMIHNGIEYGLMQAYAEGFEILQAARRDHIPEERRYQFDLPAIAQVWRKGSVVSSWLLDLTALALKDDPTLSHFSGRVGDSGEGRWTVNTAIEQGVPAEVLTTSVFKRFRSQTNVSFAEKILSALRFQFGGHQERK